MARAGGITNAVNVGIAVHVDWENREFISNISLNVRRLFDFLVQFESTTKNKLAKLNEKMDTLERGLEMLEVQVSNATANPGLLRLIDCLRTRLRLLRKSQIAWLICISLLSRRPS